MTKKIEKSKEISCFESSGCSLLRVEGFSYSFDFIHGGMGIKNALYFIVKTGFFQL